MRGDVKQDVIDTFVTLTEGIIGKNATNLVVNKCKANGSDSGKDLIFALTDQIQMILGDKGAFAVIRQVGRDIAKMIINETDEENLIAAMESNLALFGFADGIECGKECSHICNCVFYDRLVENNIAPIEHAVCWCGLGFIEAFSRKIEGVKSIEWVSRDIEAKKCKFNYIR